MPALAKISGADTTGLSLGAERAWVSSPGWRWRVQFL